MIAITLGPRTNWTFPLGGALACLLLATKDDEPLSPGFLSCLPIHCLHMGPGAAQWYLGPELASRVPIFLLFVGL